MAFWLERADGTRLALDERGVVLGRALASDVFLADRRASGLHALVRLGPQGPEVRSLGRVAVEVNGEPAPDPTPLKHGDGIAVPGEQLRLVAGPPEGPRPSWFLCRPTGAVLGIVRTPLRVGGGPPSCGASFAGEFAREMDC